MYLQRAICAAWTIGDRSHLRARRDRIVSQARFQKKQREKARRERAAAKAAKRLERSEQPPPEPTGPVRDQAAVLADLAALHEKFDDGKMSFDDFEAGKQELIEQLDVH